MRIFYVSKLTHILLLTGHMTAAVEELVTVAEQFVAYQLEEVNKQK